MKKLLFCLVQAVFIALVGCGSNQPAPQPSPMLKPTPTMQKIVVYDFWAPWCPPCRAFGPTFDKWKEKYTTDNVSFVKVNTEDEDSKDLVAKYKISALPTILVVKGEEVVGRFAGAPREEQITNLLK